MLKTSLVRKTRLVASRNRQHQSTARKRRPYRAVGLVLLLLSAIGVALCEMPAHGDDDYTTPDYLSGGGVQFRTAFSGGQGIPQIQSILPQELFPYYFAEESLFFGDLRFFPTTNLTLGGNAGLGYRYYSEGLDRVFGASAWYDGDNTRNVLFSQAGLSLESYSQNLDFRTNFYLPVGPTTRQTALSLVNNSTAFSGSNLVYSQYQAWYAALKGLDMEVGVPIPGEIATGMGLRVYGGGYYYQDNSGNSITGASSRMQANLIAGLDAQVQVTYDNFFQTRAFAGLSWTFGALHRSEMKQTTAYGRMGEHVNRNYTVVAEGHSSVTNITAIDPATGKPYTFAHVASDPVPSGPLGSAGNPYTTIAAGQASGANIVFVHAGSVFNNGSSVVLLPNQRVLGDGPGAQYYVQVPQLGTVQLPHGPSSGGFPTINGSVGDAVVLASNSEFSGFRITNSTGNGIVGNGVQNVVLNNLVVDHSGQDGILLQNIPGTPGSISLSSVVVSNSGGAGIGILNNSGLVQFLTNTSVTNPTGAGIDINGGGGQTLFSGTTTVSGAAGSAVSIENLSAGATNVTFNNLSIDHRQGMGLSINNSSGTVNVNGTLNITNESNSSASALNIANSAGNANFNAVTNITAATGNPGVNLQTDTGTTTFNTLNITSQNGTALAANNAGNLTINAAVNGAVNLSQGGVINAVNGTAIQISNTALNINLQNVSSNNAATGISLVSTTGLFAVFGNGTAGSAGTIQNDTTGIFLQNTGQTGFQWLNLNANGVGISANGVSDLIVSNSTITNSLGFGINAQNTATMSIANSTFSGNGGANVNGQFSQLGSYNYSFSGNTMTSGAGGNIVLAVVSGGEGSTMNFSDQGDTLTNTSTGTAGINIGWNGNLAATVNQTLFTVSGGGNTGLLINNASTSGMSTITMSNSGFESQGGTDTAARIVTLGPSQINLTGNTVNWDAGTGTGFHMSLGASSTVNIASNSMTDNVGGATAVLFDSLTGPGNVTINNNLLTMFNSGSDRGFIFSSITNTIQLSGTNDNRVYNAATPDFIPFGTTTGGFFVNGSVVP
jgi:hypothetical protein